MSFQLRDKTPETSPSPAATPTDSDLVIATRWGPSTAPSKDPVAKRNRPFASVVPEALGPVASGVKITPAAATGLPSNVTKPVTSATCGPRDPHPSVMTMTSRAAQREVSLIVSVGRLKKRFCSPPRIWRDSLQPVIIDASRSSVPIKNGMQAIVDRPIGRDNHVPPFVTFHIETKSLNLRLGSTWSSAGENRRNPLFRLSFGMIEGHAVAAGMYLAMG